jgi:hypothetical protein
MAGEINTIENTENNETTSEIIYSKDKDYYKGGGGELRMKAEGLFKKAKEKGISIEDIDIVELNERSAQFPGIGEISLPTFVVKVKGRDVSSGQIIVDGKQIDYFNRYQKYVAQKIESKNTVKDENGKTIYQNRRPKLKENPDFSLSDWELFNIGKELIEDKEFGFEKTITGACDRIIRKLMGENDWLYPEEARMLDEEFRIVEGRIQKEQDIKKEVFGNKKKATDRQINYFKQKLKNMGIDPSNSTAMNTVIREMGFASEDVNELNVGEMSKIIDGLDSIAPKVKELITKQEISGKSNEGISKEVSDSYKQ